jgi:hypothetical protein
MDFYKLVRRAFGALGTKTVALRVAFPCCMILPNRWGKSNWNEENVRKNIPLRPER